MKSSQEQLRSRGYATPEEIRPYREKSQNALLELLELLNDKNAVARTAAASQLKIEPEVFPVLLQVLQEDDAEKICEILDTVGSMAFYHPELSTPEHAEAVFAVMERYPSHELLLWKAIQCLCAFPSQKTKRLLQEFTAQNNLLGEEAQSSLKRLPSER